MRFPSLHKLHAQKYKTSLSHRFRQCNGKPGRWVIFHIPFFAVSARGATCGRQPAPGFPKFQFTPLREGRPGVLVEVVNVYTISIHAPARGATSTTHYSTAMSGYFNSRPCERGDLAHYILYYPLRLFQFTPLREGRPNPDIGNCNRSLFQFTPLREGRPKMWSSGGAIPYFNSRPCERGDPATRPGQQERCISIHAPARGATQRPPPCSSGSSYFNSRPCERGDWELFVFPPWEYAISIHAPARGATDLLQHPVDCGNISIHAPARGAT